MTSPSRTSPTTPPDVSPVLDVRELSVSFKTESGWCPRWTAST